MRDDFHETLLDVLGDPPTAPRDLDETRWLAGVERAIRLRRRRRNAALGSLAAVVVAAGILVPTMLSASLDGSSPDSQQAGAPQPGRTSQAADPSSPSESVTPMPESVIVATIMEAAERDKDPAPTAIQYVRGDRRSLVEFATQSQLDPRSKDNMAPSVLVVATGNFQIMTSGIGNPVVHGTALALVINEQTRVITDTSLSMKPLDLSPLDGVVHPAVPK